MAALICGIVPPQLLDALAQSSDPEISRLASRTLDHTTLSHHRRRQHFENKIANKNAQQQRPIAEGILPDQILEHEISSTSTIQPIKDAATITLALNQAIRDGSYPSSTQPAEGCVPAAPGNGPIAGSDDLSVLLPRRIHDMQHAEQKAGRDDQTYALLPGKLVRSEGDAPIADERVNQAYDNCGLVLKFFHEVFGYTFLDDKYRPIISSVHFENDYQNALWMGKDLRQMVYGDGGHNVFNFTACIEVIGHEMMHAVTEHTCHLVYQDEAGALNEHLSDAFGKMIELWSQKKLSKDASWLIGEECLMPGVKGVALRNMKFPGTAYDDPQFGKDSQPASIAEMDAFKLKHKRWADYDSGCVHAFSGVPNRAFVLISEAFGGYCWEKAGKIWWTIVTGHKIADNCNFVQFAQATEDVAQELFGDEAAQIVRSAWTEVGVIKPVVASS